MSTHEVTIGFKWIESTLSGDSQLTALAPGGVWRALAPPATAAPYVIMTFQQGTDEIAFQGVRPFSNLFFEAKAIGPGKSSQAIADAAARIDALLPTTQIAVSGGTLLGCFRMQPVEIDELVDGELWTSMGGMYHLMIKAS